MESPIMFEKVLMPTDGSEVSLTAAERALALARLAGAPLHVVFVQEPYPYTGIGAASSVGRQEYLAAGQQQVAQAFARVSALAQGQGVSLSTESVEGAGAAEHIVEAAGRCGADVIVMASHGRTGMARVLLGSVASKVLMLSPVAVMIVK
jgi:nucleotide-binding universal stress UspA family protein